MFKRRRRKPQPLTTPVESPLGARLELEDGTRITLEPRFMGTDDDGMHHWTLFPASMADFKKMPTIRPGGPVPSVHFDKMPPRTLLRFALEAHPDGEGGS